MKAQKSRIMWKCYLSHYANNEGSAETAHPRSFARAVAVGSLNIKESEEASDKERVI